MKIYIDEAGSFLPPRSARTSFSLVLALLIPDDIEKVLFYEFMRLRDSWPNQAIEIKGSSLNESQAAELIDLVSEYDVLVQFMALDLDTHPDLVVTAFKDKQADAVTKGVTRQHQPGMVLQLYQLGESVRAMPNQLFLQAFAMWLLLIRTIREGTLYYVQRKPYELGDIGWVIDRKDRTITQMEATWTTLILPMSEKIFAIESFKMIRGEDYSSFHARYGFTEATANPEMLRHMRWVRSFHGMPDGPVRGIDSNRLLTEQRTFADSRDSIGLQLCDMLAAILRRALNGQLQQHGWKDFGKLLIRHHNPSDGFVQVDPGKDVYMPAHTKEVWNILDRKAKAMVAEGERNHQQD
jgi:Protein of unknown function (DUF3800)